MLQTQQIGPKTILCGHLLNWEAYKDRSKTHWGLNSAALWLSRRKNIRWGCKGVCKPRMDLDLSWVTLPDALLPSTNAELAAKHRIVVLPGNWFTHKDVSISPMCRYAASPNLPNLRAMTVIHLPLSFDELKLFVSFVFVVVKSQKFKWSVVGQVKWACSTEDCLQKQIAADLLQKIFLRDNQGHTFAWLCWVLNLPGYYKKKYIFLITYCICSKA